MQPEVKADASPPVITDAMIRAGVIQFFCLHVSEEEPEEIVMSVYTAMNAARSCAAARP